jgi:PAS domain S-box-containing protein
MVRLHAMASRFVRDGDLPALLSQAIDTAMAIVGADTGFIATVRESPERPTLAAQRGFEPTFVEDWRSTPPPVPEQITLVDDLCADAASAAHPLLASAGARALQSTPLFDQTGKLIGLLSTQHRAPHSCDESEQRLLGAVAHQCADAIERAAFIEACAVQSAQAHEKKLWETEELFRTTVENMPDNLALYDREGHLLYLNAALRRYHEASGTLPAGEIIGKHGSELWPATFIPLWEVAKRAIETGQGQTFERTLNPPGGRVIRQYSVNPIVGPDGQVHQVLLISTDVTAQRVLVEELRTADERKGAFIAMLSHELRNPLAAIRTNLFVLEHATSGNAPAGKATKVIDRQIDHLVRMVDDLLDVTRITQNKIQLRRERLDLRALVRQTIEDNRSLLERGGVAFAMPPVEEPLHVNADGARLAQVVTNLLTNAAKFTPAGGSVRITVSPTEDGRVAVSVVDSGSGIEPELLPQLFQPFTQGDRGLARTTGGLGLGLALVKGLVELHGGQVGARSGGRDQGAEFVVTLPLEPAGAGGGETPVEIPLSVAGRRVLVIEDDPAVAEGLEAALAINQHVVEIARSGQEALERARRFKPDVVLCDIGLPGMDGYAVARAFRADGDLRSAVLVALTGYAQAEDIARARAAGFDRHLAKPASVDKIQRAVASTEPPKP